jgi:hypothetical protein
MTLVGIGFTKKSTVMSVTGMFCLYPIMFFKTALKETFLNEPMKNKA